MNPTSSFRLVCCFLLSSLPVSLPAQDSAWTVYSRIGAVHAFAEGNDDLWIGTDAGLVRLDRSTLTAHYFHRSNVVIANESIRSLAVDRRGRVWMGTHGYGLGMVDGGEWRTFTPTDRAGPFRSPWYADLVPDDSGWVWAATNDGLVHTDGEQWDAYTRQNSGLPDNYLKAVTIDSTGVLWVGTGSYGFAAFDGSTWRHWFSGNSPLPNNEVFDLAVDTAGALWISANTTQLLSLPGSVSRFDGTNWTVFDTATTVIEGRLFGDLAVDHHGAILLATDRGLYRFADDGWSVADTAGWAVDPASLIPLHADGNGVLWAGGRQSGPSRYDGTAWSTVPLASSDFPGGSVRDLAVSADNRLWLATGDDGVTGFDGRTWMVYDTVDSALPGNRIHQIAANDDGSVTALVEGGWLADFTGSGWTVRNPGDPIMPLIAPRSMTVAGDGTIWIGDQSMGLFRVDSAGFERFILPLTGRWRMNIDAIAVDVHGTVWLSANAGLARYDGRDWRFFTSVNSGLPSSAIGGLSADRDGALWIGTSEGLARYDGRFWTVFDSSNSPLPGNRVAGLTRDQLDRLWISGPEGIAIRDGGDWIVLPPDRSGVPWPGGPHIAVDDSLRLWMMVNNRLVVFAGPAATPIVGSGAAGPTGFRLFQNYPNPFNPSTRVEFGVRSAEWVTLTVYDMLGRRIRMLVDAPLPAGRHVVQWDGRDDRGVPVASGVYLYRLASGTFVAARKMVLVR